MYTRVELEKISEMDKAEIEQEDEKKGFVVTWID